MFSINTKTFKFCTSSITLFKSLTNRVIRDRIMTKCFVSFEMFWLLNIYQNITSFHLLCNFNDRMEINVGTLVIV